MGSEECRTEHEGLFAEFYDALHPDTQDLTFFTDLLADCKGRILELGSGTGRILLPLARAGHHVTGVEQSSRMLAVCRGKMEKEAAAVRKRMTLVEADVLQYCTEDRYAFILAPCNFLSYFVHGEDLLRLLKVVRSLLEDSGCFVVDQSIPDLPWMTVNNGQTEELIFSNPHSGSRLVGRFSVQYDFVNQLEFNRVEIEEYAGDRFIRHGSANTTMTFFFPRELRLFIKQARLRIAAEWGSLAEDVPITETSREMVFICSK